MATYKKLFAGLFASLMVFSLAFDACCVNTEAVSAAIISGAEVVGDTEEYVVESDDGGGFFSFLDPAVLLDTFKNLFVKTVNDWVSGIVNGAFALLDELMLDLLDLTFHVENLIQSGRTTVLTSSSLHNVYRLLYTVACSLVVLKFLFKGFQIYILWRGGDADQSPRDMLTGVMEAAFVMAAFPYLYDQLVDVVLWIAEKIMNNLGIMRMTGGGALRVVTDMVAAPGELIVVLVMDLVFFIFAVILWVKMVVQGFELLVLRMGVPLATLGLIDSDMALFKNYMQVFIKTTLTAVIQACLMSLAFRVIGTFRFLNVISAIALMCSALSTPKLLQQFLVPQGGGGFSQKIYSAAMVARAAKMLFV